MSRITLPIAALCLTLLFIGCARTPVSHTTWPADLPPLPYFIGQYNIDLANREIQTQDAYLLWVVRFYRGWELYRRGWNKMTNELLAEIPDPQQAAEAKRNIDQLGLLIAGEWAKKKDDRAIFTRHVAVWGNALLESLDRGEALTLINRISKDVNQLLDHKLSPDTITAARYYPPDENDPFL